MELNRSVIIFLNATGREALQLATGKPQKSADAPFYAFFTDETGVLVSVQTDYGEHQLLIPWSCILALDVPVGGTAPVESAV